MKHLYERGSALFLILIAVVLFAALAYAVSNMMRGGNPDTISTEKSKLFGNEILNYARSMRQAAQNVKISNGCTDADISFENEVLTGYGHTPAASDPCKIFINSGGGLVYQTPTAEWLDTLISPAPSLIGHWYFPANVCVPDTGTATATCSTDGVDNEVLIAILPYIKKELCIRINEQLGVTNPGGSPPVETGHAWSVANPKYTGSSANGEKLEQGGRMAGCFEGAAASNPGPDTYHFYQVLIPR